MEKRSVTVRVRKEGSTYRLRMHAPEGIAESEFRARVPAIGEKYTLAPARARWATEPMEGLGVTATWRVSEWTPEATARALDRVKSRLVEWMGSLGYEVEFVEDEFDEDSSDPEL